MSLVAYESSADSDSDEETPAADEATTKHDTERHKEGRDFVGHTATAMATKELNISDDEDLMWENTDQVESGHLNTVDQGSGLFASMPAPLKKEKPFVVREEGDEYLCTVKAYPTTEKEYPKVVPLANKGETVGSDGSKNNDSMSRVLLSLPKPKNTKEMETGKRGLIKIGIPALAEVDSDSDDENTKRSRKPVKPSQAGSGLVTLLPKPAHSVTFGVTNKNLPTKREPKRLLLPYSISKKKEDSKSNQKESISEQGNVKKNSKGNVLRTDSDSDDSDHEGPSSFFSFGDKNVDTDLVIEKPNVLGRMLAGNQTDSNSMKQNTDENDADMNKERHEKSPTQFRVSNFKAEEQDREVVKPPNTTKHDTLKSSYKSWSDTSKDEEVARNAAADFKAHENTGSSVSSGFDQANVIGPHESSVIGSYGNNVIGSYKITDHHGYDQNVIGPYLPHHSNLQQPPLAYPSNIATNPYQQVQPIEPCQGLHYEEVQLNDDALMKLQGKRRRPQEKVTLLDIKGDSLQGNSDHLLKQLTEESVHGSKKSKAEMPKALERRKHQITYLAFQAKEREMELKNTWASNSQTRRQTQAKYGF